MSESAYSVIWVGSAADIAPALWEACFPPPLEGRWWYETLERCGINDQFTFYYAVVFLDGEPVAIAPVFLMDMPIELVVPPALLPAFRLLGRLAPSLRWQRTLFVGSPCADEGAIGILPEVDRYPLMQALQRALWQQVASLGAALLVWKDFPLSYAADFDRLLHSTGLFRMVSFPGTVADLPGPAREDYFASLKGKRRHNLKRKLRLSAQHVEVDVEVLQHPTADTLDAIFGLFWQTYEKGSTKFERLNRKFFELIAAQPQSHFIILRERSSGDLIAFMLCFAFPGRVINKFIGLDYRQPKEWLLYFRLWEAALDWSLSMGAKSIQSGQTGYTAKIEIGHRLVPLTNYCRHRNPILHRLYAAVARQVDWHTLDAELTIHANSHVNSDADDAERH